MSYPNSVNSSRHRSQLYNWNKENQAPNFPTNSTFSPECTQKAVYSQLPSLMIRQIQQNQLNTTQHSLKTIFKYFSKTNNEAYNNYHNNTFLQAIKQVTKNPKICLKQAIKFCQTQKIYYIHQLKTTPQKIISKQLTNSQYKRLLNNKKNMLTSDLGQLKIQHICQILTHNDVQCLTRQYESILELLVPQYQSLYDDRQQQQEQQQEQQESEQKLQSQQNNKNIDVKQIRQAYQQLLDQYHIHQQQLQTLTQQFMIIYNQKIQTKILNQHIKIQLIHKIQQHTYRQKISYKSVQQILSQFFNLTKSDIRLISRYICSLDESKVPSIVDPTKKVNSKIILAILFNKNGYCADQYYQLQQSDKLCNRNKDNYVKNRDYLLEESYEKIQQLQEENIRQKQLLQQKNGEIEHLRNIIQLMEIQNNQCSELEDRKVTLRVSNCHQKYTNKINQLQQLYKNQKKMTKWYQRELQAITKAVNSQNIMRRFFAEQVSYAKKQTKY